MIQRAAFQAALAERSLPYPWARRAVIMMSFIILVVWIMVVVTYAYHDPNILCGVNDHINMLSYIAFGALVVGAGVYWISPDSQLKIQSWVRRVPMFWNSLIDSGYTPYFDPDYYEIHNGHYVRVQTNAYDIDSVGLPKVEVTTPLNSFNMAIYRKYYPTVIDSTKHWWTVKDPTKHVAEGMLRKYIIERTRIVVVGHSCMIVKAWSGEHLLIHKSKYQDFVADQIVTTQWKAINARRFADLNRQERLIAGLSYFANKLINDSTMIPIVVPPNDPMRTHYDQLIKEMAAINNAITGITPSLQQVVSTVRTNYGVPQSLAAVRSKHLDLKMSLLVSHLDTTRIQRDVIDRLPTDSSTNQTIMALNQIRDQLISPNEYVNNATEDARLTTADSILAQLVTGSVDGIQRALAPILVFNPVDRYPVPIKVLPLYAQIDLKAHIGAYSRGYSELHGLRAMATGIKERKGPIFRMMGPQSVVMRSAQALDRVSDIAANTKAFTTIELAKANAADDHLQQTKLNWMKAHAALIGVINAMKPDPQLQQIKEKSDLFRTEMERDIIDVEEQKKRLEEKLKADAEIVDAMERIKPQMVVLRDTILQQSDQLLKMEHKATQLEQTLDMTKSDLARAKDEQASLAMQLTEHSNVSTQAQADSEQHKAKNIALQLEYDRVMAHIESLTESMSEQKAQLGANKSQMVHMSAELEARAKTLEQLTAECRDKTAQLAQMALDLKTFQEQNLKITNDHQVMMKAFREEGDAKLKQLASTKDQELNGIRQEMSQAQQALIDTESKKKETELALQLTQENAKRLEAEMKAKNFLSKQLHAMKVKRITEAQQTMSLEHQKLLNQFHELNSNKMGIEAEMASINANYQHVQSNFTQLETQNLEMQQRVQQAEADQSISEAQKAQIAAQMAADQATMRRYREEAERLASQLDSQKAKNDAIEAELERHRTQVVQAATKIDAVDADIVEKMAAAAAIEAQLKVELSQEKERAISLTRLTTQLSSDQRQIKESEQQLKEALKRAELDHKDSLEAMAIQYQLKEEAFKQVCKTVMADLAKYETAIKLHLVYSPMFVAAAQAPNNLKGKEIDVDLNSELINALVWITSKYLGDSVGKSEKKIKLLTAAAQKMYPIDCAPNTFLVEIDGKVLEFVYTMYEVVKNHQGINVAITKQAACVKQSAPQFEILTKCGQFLNNGAYLFDDKSDSLFSAISNTPSGNFTSLKVLINSKDLVAVNNTLFTELGMYTFQTKVGTPIQRGAPAPAPVTRALQRGAPAPRVAPAPPSRATQAPRALPPPIEYESSERKKGPQGTVMEEELGDGQILEITTKPQRAPSGEVEEPAWLSPKTGIFPE